MRIRDDIKTGDQIVLRGRGREGQIVKRDDTWATVEWADGAGPKIVHMGELVSQGEQWETNTKRQRGTQK